MLIKLKIILFITISLLFACSQETTVDQAMIEKDRKALEEKLSTERVIIYKFFKIMIRAAGIQDTTSAQYKSITPEMRSAILRLDKLTNQQHITPLEYLMIYKDYTLLREFAIKANEDDYPTLSESTGNHGVNKKKVILSTGSEKRKIEASEHALMSVMIQLGGGFGMDAALYECAKTNTDLFEDSEEKSLLLFYRGYLFFGNKLYYLSENELTQNIDWLTANPKANLPLMRFFFDVTSGSDAKAYDSYLSLNYLFRGFDRMMMKRPDDDKRSLEDFEQFLKLSNKIGVSNEITLSIETYIHLKKGEYDKAALSLEKLNQSPNLSGTQKKNIGVAIGYLKNKETDKVLNGVYDTDFIASIASNQVDKQISTINWNNSLTKLKIPTAKKTAGILSVYSKAMQQVHQYTSGKSIEATGDSLWDKAKNLVE